VFNAIITLAQPIIAVQVDAAQMAEPAASELLVKLETYFMRPVVLVAWDENSHFMSRGFPCTEEMLISDDLEWRKFELPPEPEIPF
jgi:hypothetical protein